jgi:peptidyl-dipeptidase Dcp
MNPLLELPKTKNYALPFDQIKTEHFPEAMDVAIARGRKRIEEMKRHAPSFNNSIRALETATEDVEFVFNLLSTLTVANGDEGMHKLTAELGPRLAAFNNDILLDPEIFAQIRTVYEQRNSLALSKSQIHLVEKVYRDFEHNGAVLPEDKKARLRELDGRLAVLRPKFRDNVLKANNSFDVWVEAEADLAGLSEFTKTAAKEAAIEKGQPEKWHFSSAAPSYLPVMEEADNRALREKMFRGVGARAFGGEFDNQPVALEIARLMFERAQLLGFKSYAHFALQERMAETPEEVIAFLDKVQRAAKPVAESEVAEMTELSVKTGGPAQLQQWDRFYYGEKVKKARYAFDDSELRPYFRLENVLQGAFDLAGQLYGLKFEESQEYPVYHEDVRVFEVYKDKGETEFVGLFYTDFFPRPTKSQGAWMTNFYEQGVFRGKLIRPHVTIVCNFTKPTKTEPSLLSYSEVKTLFHEFGHALHGLLSNVEHRTLAGTNVHLDFVELPSQIMENWTKHHEPLSMFAKHYKTGEVIPSALIDRLQNSLKFLVGYQSLRQVNLAKLDLAWYLTPPLTENDVVEFERRATTETTILPRVEGTATSPSFLHIFGGGYASGYYSYKWAEALDADAFELFQEKGLFDRETAERFEEFILSKGGSDHPMRLYEQFRGRRPDPEALLRRDGLI